MDSHQGVHDGPEVWGHGHGLALCALPFCPLRLAKPCRVKRFLDSAELSEAELETKSSRRETETVPVGPCPGDSSVGVSEGLGV